MIAPPSPVSPSLPIPPPAPLLRTPLHALHLELGARMVPFAGYDMPVQYPAGLVAEHLHTRAAAGLFDVSHMGQLRLVGADAARAFESLMPVDVVDLPAGRQRYGLLTDDTGGIRDDLMFANRGDDLFVVVNGACKAADIAHMQARIGNRCDVLPLPDRALLALQGPQAVDALARLAPAVAAMRFMDARATVLDGEAARGAGVHGLAVFVTRSGYTGEDGFEISVAADDADALARGLLAQPEVKPIGLGARNSLRLEAGLCLHGNDIDTSSTPVEAALGWAMQKVRRADGARAGGFPGAERILGQLADADGSAGHLVKKRVLLVAQERVPVREPAPLRTPDGAPAGQVTSGLLSPSTGQPVAMGYVPTALAAVGTELVAIVRGKPVAMRVVAGPFVPHRYFRG